MPPYSGVQSPFWALSTRGSRSLSFLLLASFPAPLARLWHSPPLTLLFSSSLLCTPSLLSSTTPLDAAKDIHQAPLVGQPLRRPRPAPHALACSPPGQPPARPRQRLCVLETVPASAHLHSSQQRQAQGREDPPRRQRLRRKVCSRFYCYNVIVCTLTDYHPSLPSTYDPPELTRLLTDHLSAHPDALSVKVIRDSRGGMCAFIQCEVNLFQFLLFYLFILLPLIDPLFSAEWRRCYSSYRHSTFRRASSPLPRSPPPLRARQSPTLPPHLIPVFLSLSYSVSFRFRWFLTCLHSKPMQAIRMDATPGSLPPPGQQPVELELAHAMRLWRPYGSKYAFR